MPEISCLDLAARENDRFFNNDQMQILQMKKSARQDPGRFSAVIPIEEEAYMHLDRCSSKPGGHSPSLQTVRSSAVDEERP